MPKLEIDKWPEFFTNKSWQAKKGLLAKKAGKTGVGEAMDAGKKAHEGVVWTDFDIATHVRPSQQTPSNIEAELPKIASLFNTKVAGLRAALELIRKKANEAVVKFKKDKLIPAASAKYAEEMAKFAEFYLLGLKPSSDEAKRIYGVGRIMASAKSKTAETLKVVSVQINACRTGIAATKKNPTKQGWQDDGLHQGCRSVCNGIKAVPEWNKRFFATWSKFGDFYHKDVKEGDPQEKNKILAKVQEVEKELNTYEAFIKKELG